MDEGEGEEEGEGGEGLIRGEVNRGDGGRGGGIGLEATY